MIEATWWPLVEIIIFCHQTADANSVYSSHELIAPTDLLLANPLLDRGKADPPRAKPCQGASTTLRSSPRTWFSRIDAKSSRHRKLWSTRQVLLPLCRAQPGFCRWIRRLAVPREVSNRHWKRAARKLHPDGLLPDEFSHGAVHKARLSPVIAPTIAYGKGLRDFDIQGKAGIGSRNPLLLHKAWLAKIRNQTCGTRK